MAQPWMTGDDGLAPEKFPAWSAYLTFLGESSSGASDEGVHEVRKDFTNGHIRMAPLSEGVKFGPANVVILNNYRDVQDGICSSRPENYIANTLICPNDTHILFAPYTAGWKSLRKADQALFVPREIANVNSIQNAKATQTIHDIHDPLKDYYEHIQRYTTAVILASVYGQRGEEFSSSKVQALYNVQNEFTALLEPGAAPSVDARLSQKIGESKETGCFMEKLLGNQEKSQLDEEHIAYLEAGLDKTSSTLQSFLLGILRNPEALRQAQKDVDRCCRTERTPGPEDLENMPSIEACMNETLRWRPVTAGGIPHIKLVTRCLKRLCKCATELPGFYLWFDHIVRCPEKMCKSRWTVSWELVTYFREI